MGRDQFRNTKSGKHAKTSEYKKMQGLVVQTNIFFRRSEFEDAKQNQMK